MARPQHPRVMSSEALTDRPQRLVAMLEASEAHEWWALIDRADPMAGTSGTVVAYVRQPYVRFSADACNAAEPEPGPVERFYASPVGDRDRQLLMFVRLALAGVYVRLTGPGGQLVAFSAPEHAERVAEQLA